MSVSMLEQLSALLNGKTAPSEQKPIAKGSAFLLIRLLNSKEFNASSVVTVNGDGLIAEDGSQITYGDLSFVEEAERPDGSFGRHYPNVWVLTQTEASAAIEWLESKPAKASNGYRRNGGKGKPAAKAAESNNNELLSQLVALLQSQQVAESAKPIAAAGHRKVSRSTETVADEATEIVNLAPGQIVTVDGERRQVSADGKRLNKTVV